MSIIAWVGTKDKTLEFRGHHTNQSYSKLRTTPQNKHMASLRALDARNTYEVDSIKYDTINV